MNANDDDLYGDIDLLSRNIKIDQLEKTIEDKDKSVSALQTELDQVKSQFTLMITEKQTLEKNMVALYNTAVRELQRKDHEIAELREQLRRK
jgi:CII-binding regulator of phage lambda lysogenization HflD